MARPLTSMGQGAVGAFRQRVRGARGAAGPGGAAPAAAAWAAAAAPGTATAGAGSAAPTGSPSGGGDGGDAGTATALVPAPARNPFSSPHPLLARAPPLPLSSAAHLHTLNPLSPPLARVHVLRQHPTSPPPPARDRPVDADAAGAGASVDSEGAAGSKASRSATPFALAAFQHHVHAQAAKQRAAPAAQDRPSKRAPKGSGVDLRALAERSHPPPPALHPVTLVGPGGGVGVVEAGLRLPCFAYMCKAEGEAEVIELLMPVRGPGSGGRVAARPLAFQVPPRARIGRVQASVCCQRRGKAPPPASPLARAVDA